MFIRTKGTNQISDHLTIPDPLPPTSSCPPPGSATPQHEYWASFATRQSQVTALLCELANTNTCIHTRAHTFTYVHMDIHTDIDTDMYSCTHTRARAHVYAYVMQADIDTDMYWIFTPSHTNVSALRQMFSAVRSNLTKRNLRVRKFTHKIATLNKRLQEIQPKAYVNMEWTELSVLDATDALLLYRLNYVVWQQVTSSLFCASTTLL